MLVATPAPRFTPRAGRRLQRHAPQEATTPPPAAAASAPPPVMVVAFPAGHGGRDQPRAPPLVMPGGAGGINGVDAPEAFPRGSALAFADGASAAGGASSPGALSNFSSLAPANQAAALAGRPLSRFGSDPSLRLQGRSSRQPGDDLSSGGANGSRPSGEVPSLAGMDQTDCIAAIHGAAARAEVKALLLLRLSIPSHRICLGSSPRFPC